MTDIVEKFFIISAAGLYEVLLISNGVVGFSLQFKKCAWRSGSSLVKDYREDWSIDKTPPGSFIGVAYHYGIMVLDPGYTRLEKPGKKPPFIVEDFNFNVCGEGYAPRIKPVVAMFLDWDAALSCFNVSFREAWHERWWKESLEVLEMMKRYPFFIHDREMAKRLQ
jgi:hypothetical protein